MSNSYSAEVWLNEHRWDALEKVLEEQGTSIEKYLQDYLVELYREMVPSEQVEEIEKAVRQEQLRDLEEREARKVFSAFRLLEGGKNHFLATESPVEMLDAARLLRICLREDAGGADAFARKIHGAYEVTQERFDELTQARLDNTGRVAGVFELDFDKKVFSAVSIMDGWKNYWFQDVSAAAYHAYRKDSTSRDQRLRKLVERLDGKELTDWDLITALKFHRKIQPEELWFTDSPIRRGHMLDFKVYFASDTAQMEVFGPKVGRIEPGNRLDIVISYDVARQALQDHLELALYRKDGTRKKSFTYDLSPSERELLTAETENYCQKRYKSTLNDLYEVQYSQASVPVAELDGGGSRLDLDQISFEGEIAEYDNTLNFYIPVTFDPDAVFGTRVTDTANDDWLNVYANYDLESGQVDSALSVFLMCGDGNEFEFSYPLNAEEQELLRQKMEDYCQQMTGQSLEEYQAALFSPEQEQGLGPLAP